MPLVFLSIGSNLGDRENNIKKAIEQLKDLEKTNLESVSRIIETKPHEATGPNYLNTVICLRSSLRPKELLEKIQSIENKLGRIRSFKNSPRTIDIDILLYGRKCIDEPDLKVPHPQIRKRGFILELLLEIEPDADKAMNIS